LLTIATDSTSLVDIIVDEGNMRKQQSPKYQQTQKNKLFSRK